MVQRDSLTDGSYVYNVVMPGVELHAVDEKAAHALAEEIVEAINRHSITEAKVTIVYF